MGILATVRLWNWQRHFYMIPWDTEKKQIDLNSRWLGFSKWLKSIYVYLLSWRDVSSVTIMTAYTYKFCLHSSLYTVNNVNTEDFTVYADIMLALSTVLRSTCSPVCPAGPSWCCGPAWEAPRWRLTTHSANLLEMNTHLFLPAPPYWE